MANRQQRRRTKSANDNYDEMNVKNILITLAIVMLVLGLFSLMTIIINNKNRRLDTKEKEKTEVEIQYSKILGDNTFTMPEDEYYVLFYDTEGVNAPYYSYISSEYIMFGKIYIVDLNDGFNKKFVSEETNNKAKNAGGLKVKDGTLIKIKNGKNVKYIDSSDEDIASELGF